jgi:hypothetical protein
LGRVRKGLVLAGVCRFSRSSDCGGRASLRKSLAVSSPPDAPLLDALKNSNPLGLDSLVNSEKTRDPVA